MFTQIAIILS